MTTLMVFGGTGVVGRGVLEAASADETIGETRALQRGPVSPELPRVTTVHVANFADLSPHAAAFEHVDVCVFALGVAQAKVTPEEYRRVTLDYPLEAARQLVRGSPGATFVFVSGQGADPTGKSRVLFARVKGEAETALGRLGLRRLVVARPGMVIPLATQAKPAAYKTVFAHLSAVVPPLSRAMVIDSAVLGLALVRAGRDPSAAPLLGNADLRRLGTVHA